MMSILTPVNFALLVIVGWATVVVAGSIVYWVKNRGKKLNWAFLYGLMSFCIILIFAIGIRLATT